MGFSRDDIYRLLRSYKSNLGRCAHLRVEIKYIESLSEIDCDGLVEHLVFRSKDPSNTSFGSGIGDPTASIAIKVADRRKEIAHEWGRELLKMQMELYDKLRDCGYVEGWLQGLRDREKCVLQWHIIDGISWNTIPGMFTQHFEGEYSLDGVRKIQKRAIRFIQEMTR